MSCDDTVFLMLVGFATAALLFTKPHPDLIWNGQFYASLMLLVGLLALFSISKKEDDGGEGR